jgi:hypothetical protein
VTKITKLTPEHEAIIPEFRAKWIALGESTARSSPAEMRDAVNGLYDSIGQKRVPIFVMDSPLGCIVAANLFRANIGDNIRANIWDNIGANIGANIGDNIGANIWANIWANIGANIWANIRANIWDNIGANIGANIGDNIRANIRDNIWDNIGDNIGELKLTHENASMWGNHDLGWIAFASFFETIGHAYPANLATKLQALRRYHETCGWLYCFDGMAFVSQLPTIVRRDETARLHCETGNAIEYADGYGFCAWRGTRIPSEWVFDRKSLSAKTAITWTNLEQRRIACSDIVGWAKILKELDAKIIDEDGDPQIGTLVEVKLPDLPQPARFCRVLCGTGREFAVGVPREVKTALEAQAWMQNKPLKDFSLPEIRT